jgi:hypothetical protein
MGALRPREVAPKDYSFTTPSRSAPVLIRATSLFNAKTEFMSQFGYYPEGETDANPEASTAQTPTEGTEQGYSGIAESDKDTYNGA